LSLFDFFGCDHYFALIGNYLPIFSFNPTDSKQRRTRQIRKREALWRVLSMLGMQLAYPAS
ncbi:hypothetical protein, partial [Pseudomonas aeruginosa]|uniref:hypothetical protein n=1 Tax=Pseudomonas aeruginosa TaxID=287 RepID=UPI002363DEA4